MKDRDPLAHYPVSNDATQLRVALWKVGRELRNEFGPFLAATFTHAERLALAARDALSAPQPPR